MSVMNTRSTARSAQNRLPTTSLKGTSSGSTTIVYSSSSMIRRDHHCQNLDAGSMECDECILLTMSSNTLVMVRTKFCLLLRMSAGAVNFGVAVPESPCGDIVESSEGAPKDEFAESMDALFLCERTLGPNASWEPLRTWMEPLALRRWPADDLLSVKFDAAAISTSKNFSWRATLLRASAMAASSCPGLAACAIVVGCTLVDMAGVALLLRQRARAAVTLCQGRRCELTMTVLSRAGSGTGLRGGRGSCSMQLCLSRQL
mmetsp:Transcript_29601/g.43879  ORF Transcript_29601/g.43879 Transcript_29601/m.43879 type:complete len:260 (+) Transcript_29601:235-1014(+)